MRVTNTPRCMMYCIKVRMSEFVLRDRSDTNIRGSDLTYPLIPLLEEAETSMEHMAIVAKMSVSAPNPLARPKNI
jgi:hypothetical protein